MLASPVTIQARQILDIVYPVGMVLMFNNGTDPNNIMHGQTWTKLPGGYALTTTNNTNGGDASLLDAQNHKPGYSYQGGLPNITGRLVRASGDGDSGLLFRESGNVQAAGFGALSATTRKYGGTVAGGSAGVGGYNLEFNASGSSDRYGTYQSLKVSVVADHYAVVAWKRTG